MNEGGIVRAAEEAGFKLTQVEAAALRAIAAEGCFDGLEFRKSAEGIDLTHELAAWFPSVWRNDTLAETDNVSKHHELYEKAPFPIISGALVEWVLTKEAAKYLRNIHLGNTKVAGPVNSTRCELDCNVRLVDCVFQDLLKISGQIRGELSLTGICAGTVVLSGDISAGVYLNDVQCRLRLSRYFGGLYLEALKSPFVKIYGVYTPQDMVRFRDCAVSEIEIRGRGLACTIRMDHCKVDEVFLEGWTEDDYSMPFFEASGLTVEGTCSVAHVQGASIRETVIGGDFKIADVRSTKTFYLPLEKTIMLSNVEVTGTLSIDMNPDANGIHLTFQNVRAYLYEDRPEDLRAIDRLEADGLAYQELVSWGDEDIQKRTEWLLKQSGEPFPVASWRRIAMLLRRRGKFHEARKMLIEGERQRRYMQGKGTGACCWSWLLRTSIGYGWELWRVGLFAIVLVLVGTGVASVGMERGLLSETTERPHYVSFNPLVYSIDEALPIIDLRHSSRWLPTGKGWDGRAVQVYFWIHTILGWVIATLFVIGFTGVARKAEDG